MNYTKQTDWFDLQVDSSAKVITVKQRWLYKWAYQPGEKTWTEAEEKQFLCYPQLLIHLFWRAIPRLKVKGSSPFAKANNQSSFELRFELEQSPTHPLLGVPHWSIHVYKHSRYSATSSSVFWHSRRVILNLNEALGAQSSLSGSLRYASRQGFSPVQSNSTFTARANSVVNGIKNTQSHAGKLSEHFDRENIMNSGLTLRELNFEYLLRELNKLLPNTTFYSDFSTQFDYHSTITQGISSGGPAPEAKEYNRRVKTSMFNTFVFPRPEPEATPENNIAELPKTLPAKTVLDPEKKPKHSPTINKWQDKGGRIEVTEEGNWKYIDWQGNEVTYYGDFPDFSQYIRQQVDIENMQGNCTSDFDDADEKAPLGAKLVDNTWHHHENLKTMQEVPLDIHGRFTHYGARSIIKNKNTSSIIKKRKKND